MGNVLQQAETGTPSISLRWSKNAIVKTEVVKNADGRFVCRIKVNEGDFFNLPGTHPTESDADNTLKCYVEENAHKEDIP